ncbi:kinase-like domain-containing protein [Sparassis latifolia]
MSLQSPVLPAVYARLLVTNSTVHQQIYISSDHFTIGRASYCDLVIDEPFISSIHCVITRRVSPDSSTTVSLRGLHKKGVYVDRNRVAARGFELPQSCVIHLASPEFCDTNDVPAVAYSHIPPDSIFAVYDLGEEIGRGGYGIVHKGQSRITGRACAVKTLRKSRLPPAGGRDYIKGEIEILQSLSHPNIVRLYQVFDDVLKVYIVMELISEGTLAQLIERAQGLHEAEAKLITADICSALVNVLIESQSPLKAKVSDFGMAKVTSGTVLKSICGTPFFMAPEIFTATTSASGTYDEKVDSWGVGVTLFTMLASVVPFRKSNTRILAAVGMDQRRVEWQSLPPATTNEGMIAISPDFKLLTPLVEVKDLLRKLLATDPRVRLAVDHVSQHRWLKPRPPSTIGSAQHCLAFSPAEYWDCHEVSMRELRDVDSLEADKLCRNSNDYTSINFSPKGDRCLPKVGRSLGQESNSFLQLQMWAILNIPRALRMLLRHDEEQRKILSIS